jgi:ABC-type uncharacterized transport system substrate-binding protein
MRLQFVEARRDPADFDRAFSDITRARAGALILLPSNLFLRERRRLVDLAARHRLPAVYPWRDAVDAGGLMSYGASLTDSSRRAATYVDKILKGAKPGDLPVEQPTKFELFINLIWKDRRQAFSSRLGSPSVSWHRMNNFPKRAALA